MVQSVVTEIADEFRGAELGDGRRNMRLIQLAESMAREPNLSFPKAMSEAKLEAAYRFFNNVKVEPAQVLRPHIEQTVTRMGAAGAVTLVAHDTSTISFQSEYREGLAERGDTQQFLLHCSLALKGDGSRQPLGVVALSQHLPVKSEGWRLQDRWGAQVQAVHGLGVSVSNVIHLMDREADDYELLDLLQGMGARFVLRMHHDRVLEGGSLRESLQRADFKVEREVALSRRGKLAGSKQRRIHPPRKERGAILSIATLEVTIPRTKRATNARQETLSLNVVRVWEQEPPEGETPVEWALYTSEPIATPEQALQVVDWYRARWVIEEFFKALKTGCALEQRQLGDMHALSNAVALLVPIAWRLLLLKTEARDRPAAAATTVLDQDEIDVLRLTVVERGRRRLPDNPTACDVMLSLASLGGHLKHNGLPGWQTLAHGYETLRTLVAGWRLRGNVEAGFLKLPRDQ
jgi:hypothetical protein